MLATLLKFRFCLFISITVFSLPLPAQSQCTIPVWSDEFNGTAVDLTKWAYQTGNGCPNLCGWGNGELENYTKDSKNIFVSNGILTIKAVKESVNGSSFTSSKLVTLGLASWKYGRFEAKMKMPLGTGLWPAFWMLSNNNNWPMTGEIDIMEYRGDKPKETNGTLHYGSPWPQNQWDGSSLTASTDLSSDFHIYAVEWEENEIRWYLDKTLFKKETKTPNSLNPQSNGNTWPWNTEFYIILNLAVGGGYTGNPSAAQIQLTKPTFEIDYVRAYKLPCLTAGIQANTDIQTDLVTYPQPFDELLQIILPDSDKAAMLIIKELNGRILKQIESSTGSIETAILPAGIYILEITQNNRHFIKKVVKI